MKEKLEKKEDAKRLLVEKEKLKRIQSQKKQKDKAANAE